MNIVWTSGVLGACLPAWGATIHVNGTCGNNAWGGMGSNCLAPLTMNRPKRTIQAAINAAQSGDTVFIASGEYTGPENRDLDLANKNLVIQGQSPAESTVINCQGMGRGFWIHGGQTDATIIQTLTIRNGDATGMAPPYGGGILCDGARPKLIKINVIDNKAHFGGGVSVRQIDGEVTIDKCFFQSNEATDGDGGGLQIVKIAAPETSPKRITECTIQDNIALGGDGGGLWVSTDVLTLDDSDFTGNFAEGSGGELNIDKGEPVIKSCLFAAPHENEVTPQAQIGFLSPETALFNKRFS
jgi:hypothetical protein